MCYLHHIMASPLGKPMPPEELRRALDDLGMSQMDLARFLNVYGQTVRRWVAPGGEPPASVAILLRLLISRPELKSVVGLK